MGTYNHNGSFKYTTSRNRLERPSGDGRPSWSVLCRSPDCPSPRESLFSFGQRLIQERVSNHPRKGERTSRHESYFNGTRLPISILNEGWSGHQPDLGANQIFLSTPSGWRKIERDAKGMETRKILPRTERVRPCGLSSL